MTLNSDLNVGCAIPIDDDCDKRFAVEPISDGLFNRIGPANSNKKKEFSLIFCTLLMYQRLKDRYLRGGAKNPDVADCGKDVTVASGPLLNEFPDELNEFAPIVGRANVTVGVE